MKLLALEGTFQNGKIDLTELPVGLQRSRVVVTFLDADPVSIEPHLIRFGELASPERIANARYSTEADFEIAEYDGQKRWGSDDGR